MSSFFENAVAKQAESLRRITEASKTGVSSKATPTIGNTVDRPRQEHEQARAIQGQVVSSQGFILTKQAGEVAQDVKFSVRFIERPLFTFGGELDENQSASAGRFPTVSAVVLQWEIEELDKYRKYFIGANLGLVTTGATTQRMWVHWRMEGKALLGPGGGADIAI